MKSIVITQLKHGLLAGVYVARQNGVPAIVGSKTELPERVVERVKANKPDAKIGVRQKDGKILWG